MATVQERLDSSEGDADGLAGIQAVRRFDVFLDSGAGNDSITGRPDNINNAIDPISVRYPYGSAHHVNALLTAQNWRQVRRVDGDATRAQWIVEVEYSGPLSGVGTILEGWIVDYDVALQTENVFKDINGKLIGGSAYELPENATPGGAQVIAKTIEGDMNVIQMPRENVINPRSLQRFKPLSTIQLRRTVVNLTEMQVANAETFVGKINSRPFLTGGSGQILVAPMRIRQQEGTTSERVSSGVVFNVELNFIKNRNGWRFAHVDDFFEWKGYRGAVHEPGTTDKPIRNTYSLYEAGTLTGMLGNFAGGSSGSIRGDPKVQRSGFRPGA